jgi:membrane protein implicated in regulation of membrane protease activity
MMIPSLLTTDGRKAWSFISLLGACFVFTGFAAWGVWHVRGHTDWTFWLAVIAHVQIALVLAVFGAQFVRRTVKAGRDGVEISDHAVGE